MNKICVFAGTTEGRELVEYLKTQECHITACVATDLGGALLSVSENLNVIEKRLDEDDMRALFTENSFDLVIDATHPYADVVTQNIFSACERTATEYVRLLRAGSGDIEGAVYVPDIAGAVEYLNGTRGNILLTTGSKDLVKYSGIKDFSERVYARLLPLESSLKSCEEAGVKPSHIIAMQGPFRAAMNSAMIEMSSAEYVVTKDSGSAGGFAEKASAAIKSGAVLVIIGRPPQLQGKSYSEVLDLLEDRFGFIFRQKVTVVGIGPGSRGAMTNEVLEAVARADCLIGAERMIEAVKQGTQPSANLISPDKISDYIRSHKEFRSFAVIMSGDSGFFSGTKKLVPMLSFCDVKVLPGLSSMSVMAAAIQRSYEDVLTVSVHGRDYDVIPDVSAYADVFILTGGDPDIKNICGDLIRSGLEDVKVHIGERLSYPDQKITSGSPDQIMKGSYEKLSVIWIENPKASRSFTFGLPESAFIRGEGKRGLIPMTKPEVRAVCLSKLMMEESFVSWDIGAGTGSVSVEMALASKRGKVYAVEKDEDAVKVLKKNILKFRLRNITVTEGTAPEACEDLPAPDRVFIGGSLGGAKDIIALAKKKNPSVRITATAVTLEAAALLTRCLKEFEWTETDVVSVNVSSARKAGAYNLMTAQNPVYIFTMQ